MRQDELGAGHDEISKDLAGLVVHDGPDRHLERRVVAVCAILVAALTFVTVYAVTGLRGRARIGALHHI